jgi:3-phenylpropionate/trans-cinnamate dioxygenase ferredoxin subunit
LFQEFALLESPLAGTNEKKMPEPSFTSVTSAEEIPEKGFACFNVAGKSLVICRFRGEFFALENLCSHAASTFDAGRMRGYRLMCPLHGGTFDIRDGSATGAPAIQAIRSFPVRVVEGTIAVDLTD